MYSSPEITVNFSSLASYAELKSLGEYGNRANIHTKDKLKQNDNSSKIKLTQHPQRKDGAY